MKNKGIIVVLVLYFILHTADLISTLLLGDLVIHLEANPIYKYLGLTGIYILGLVVGGAVYLLYNHYGTRDKHAIRFFLMNLMIMVCLIKFVVILNNVAIYQDPPTMEQAMAITTGEKQAFYVQTMLPSVLPLLMGLLTFLFFKWDNIIWVKR